MHGNRLPQIPQDHTAIILQGPQTLIRGNRNQIPNIVEGKTSANINSLLQVAVRSCTDYCWYTTTVTYISREDNGSLVVAETPTHRAGLTCQ